MARTKKESKIEVESKKQSIDKKVLIKEIKEEIKASLMEEITITIENETKNKLDSIQKRIYRHKKVTIYKRNIIIIFLLVLLIFETKILFDNNLIPFLSKNSCSNREVITNNSKEEIKDTKWYIKKYSYLLDNIQTNLPKDNMNYLYTGNYNEESISNDIKLNMAYQLLKSSDINTSNGVITVREDKLKEAYSKIFGSTDNYQEGNFVNNCIQFIYNETFHTYMAISISCEEPTEKVLEEITSIYEEDSKIIIETIAGIKDSTNTLYQIDKTLVDESFSNNLIDYQDSLNKYKYTFKKVEDNYYFESIEKSS